MTVGEALQMSRQALAEDLHGLASRTGDCERVARIMVLLGLDDAALEDWIASRQRGDGGWSSMAETAWCSSAVRTGHENSSSAGLRWIKGQRLQDGGWGATQRDAIRIPLTSHILRLHGHLIGKPGDWAELERCWARDFASTIRLTYKGAFYLLCQSTNSSRNPGLERKTLDYLEDSANDDGGFGPWRDHPIGSDPWSTGIVLVGLCSSPELADGLTIERAAHWLVDRQLDSGYWPYHFIDEGTGYAHWGLSEAEKSVGEA